MIESNRIENKRELSDSLEKEVIAFLNSSEGGVIYLGIDKAGKIVGLEDADEVEPGRPTRGSHQYHYPQRLYHRTGTQIRNIRRPSGNDLCGYIHPGEEREDFFAGYSIPRNKTLMRVFKDLDMVEYLGSGMPRILKAYSRDAYIFSSRFVRTVFPMDQAALVLEKEEIMEGGAIGSAIGGAIELTNRQREILELIKSDSKISYRAIASTLGINESAVQKQLDTLKGKGVLKRVGGTRGHWEVLE